MPSALTLRRLTNGIGNLVQCLKGGDSLGGLAVEFRLRQEGGTSEDDGQQLPDGIRPRLTKLRAPHIGPIPRNRVERRAIDPDSRTTVGEGITSVWLQIPRIPRNPSAMAAGPDRLFAVEASFLGVYHRSLGSG